MTAASDDAVVGMTSNHDFCECESVSRSPCYWTRKPTTSFSASTHYPKRLYLGTCTCSRAPSCSVPCPQSKGSTTPPSKRMPVALDSSSTSMAPVIMRWERCWVLRAWLHSSRSFRHQELLQWSLVCKHGHNYSQPIHFLKKLWWTIYFPDCISTLLVHPWSF